MDKNKFMPIEDFLFLDPFGITFEGDNEATEFSWETLAKLDITKMVLCMN